MSGLGEQLAGYQYVEDLGNGGQDNRFEHYPVTLDEFVTGREYLANPPLSLVQYQAVRYAERVYYQHTYEWLAANAETPEQAAYWGEPLRMTNFVTLEWGKGGGKDHIARIISLRVAHLLLCLTSPLQYFVMPEQDTIHLLNVASSAPQANRAFFTPMRRAVTRHGGWFAQHGYAHPLKGTIEYAKGLEAISGHSDAETQEGLNLILGVADEIDAFKTLKELEKHLGAQARESSRSAEGVLKMLRSSARTRFPQTFKNVRISWPRYLGSMIQQLIAQGELSVQEDPAGSAHFTSGPLATWDVNPRVDGPRYFADDYKEDPAGSKARYECKPGRAINPYFSNEMAIKACIRETPRQPLVISYFREPNAWRADYDFGAELYPVRGANYSMHADLAVSGDRAGIAMSHVQSFQEVTVTGYDVAGKEVEVSEQRPVVVVDFVASYESDLGADPSREIQIRWARMLCLEMRRRGFNIRRFTFDGFQSTDSMQILLTHGIESERVSTDLSEDPWRTLRDLFSEGRISLQERAIVYNELLGLSKLPNGKIDHLGDGSKDEADALACSVFGAVILGGHADEKGTRAFLADHEMPDPQPLLLPVGWEDPRMSLAGSAASQIMAPTPTALDGMGRPMGWDGEAAYEDGFLGLSSAEPYHQG